MERRGAVRAEPSSSEEELTPVRNYRLEKTYHGEQTRAPVARGGGGAAGEMERPTASGSGRNGQRRRWRLCGRWWVRALLLLVLAKERKQMRWRRGWQTRRSGCTRDRRGAGQAGGAARRARRRMVAMRRARSGVGQARRTGAGARCGGRPGRLADWAGKRGVRPTKEEKACFKLFSIPISFNANFEQFQSSFKLWPKNKSCSKIYSLQLCFYDQSQTPNIF